MAHSNPALTDGTVARMIRVNQAGEYGAVRIYAGQLAVMGDRHPFAADIRHMAAQEAAHKAAFDAMIPARRVRPTLLQPFWHVAGYALGAATALIGPKAAMACTVAVETEIDRHYAAQIDQLGVAEPALRETIAQFQAEELEHKATARDRGAEQAVAYPLMSAMIRAGCRLAIRVSERL